MKVDDYGEVNEIWSAQAKFDYSYRTNETGKVKNSCVLSWEECQVGISGYPSEHLEFSKFENITPSLESNFGSVSPAVDGSTIASE